MKLIILKIIIKILKPSHRVLIQKIDQEYVVLITPKKNQEGLISLISDRHTLENYVSLNEVHSKMLTHECELKFKPKS